MMNTVLQTIQKFDMLSSGDSVAVGVSGGKDSVALLHILCALREEYRLKLTAVHVHHGIRGEEADRDEAFVAALCDAWQVPLKCFHFDVPAEANRRGIGEEECGRVLRYEAFRSLGADKIATAHTLSDSVETVLFHLARGSGTKALCGIPANNENIIRPLIECTSDDILAYLSENALSFVEDSTNDFEQYTRNFIRKNAVGALKEVNPAFERHMLQTMEVFASQEAFLSAAARRHLEKNGTDAAKIAALPEALKAQVIREICFESVGVVPEYKHLKAVENLLTGGKQVQINSGALARVRKGKLEFVRTQAIEPYAFALDSGTYALPIGTLQAATMNCEQFENFTLHRFSFALDYDTIKHDLTCRSRQEGDVFYDGKRHLSKSMKKYFNEMAFPPELRAGFPVFCVGDKVIGTLGSSADTDFAPGKHTKTVLYIFWEETHG